MGDIFPKWALISIDIAARNSGKKVILLCTKRSPLIDKSIEQIEIGTFYNGVDLNFPHESSQFRNGFWIKTTERFMVLKSFVRQSNITMFFHAELDNLIFDISDLPQRLNAIGEGLFIPKDSRDRCIASLIYVNKPSLLDAFCLFVSDSLGIYANDMELLGAFSKIRNDVFFLPNEKRETIQEGYKALNFSQTQGLFDAAAIGQFLFGIDLRNTRCPVFNLFVNENSTLEELLRFYIVSIESNKASLDSLRLYNIHVHSKVFHKLRNREWVQRVVSKVNAGKSSFIGYHCPWRM
jgi:hypothetical protein